MATTPAKDAIAAIATAPGTGGVAIIRVSGAGALEILKKMFASKTPFEHAKMVYGRVVGQDGTIDTGYAVYFRAPLSYTGEDTAELHVHGGWAGACAVLNRVIECGARAAQPGEFSKRAFINGKLDLTMAEAVCDFINAEGAACAKEASRQMRGSLGTRLAPITEALLELIASAEAAVEYPEEDLEDALLKSAAQTLPRLIEQTAALSATYAEGRMLKAGIRVAITGKPNAGKSSLLNALLGERRAIVSAMPGTTRDVIEARAPYGGLVFKFLDTAGIRNSADETERIGIELANRAVAGADIALLTLDSSRPLTEEDASALNAAKASGAKLIVLLNKTDLPRVLSTEEARAFAGADPIEVCANNPADAQVILAALKNAASATNSQAGVTIINARHAELLNNCALSLKDALLAIEDGLGAECALTDLKDALSSLYEITGDDVNTQVIDRIFSRFCLGK